MTGAEIAATLDMAASTVSGILTRVRLGRIGRGAGHRISSSRGPGHRS